MLYFVRQALVLNLIVFAILLSMPALAQERGDRGGERGGDRESWRERWENMSEEEREAMRKRMEERRAEYESRQAEQLRERLGISEEDFEAITPLINKVRTASRERESAFRGNRRGGWSSGEVSDSAKAATEALSELRTAIEEDKNDEIKAALGKLRKARGELDKKLKEAREELRGVCTAKWEAEFVMMGLLD